MRLLTLPLFVEKFLLDYFLFMNNGLINWWSLKVYIWNSDLNMYNEKHLTILLLVGVSQSSTHCRAKENKNIVAVVIIKLLVGLMVDLFDLALKFNPSMKRSFFITFFSAKFFFHHFFFSINYKYIPALWNSECMLFDGK